MEPTKPGKLTHALRTEPVEDFGGTPTKGGKTSGIGIVVLAVMRLILTSVGRCFHRLKTVFVLNRVQAFCDAVMIDARNDDYGSGRSFVSWGYLGVHEFVRHEARL